MIRPRKRNRPIVPIAIAGAIALLAVGAVIAFFVRDGGDDAPVTPEPTQDASGFGRAPDLDGHVIEIYPPHGATVTQADTRPGPGRPGAVCFRMRFGNTNGTWYRVAVDAVEVTQEMIWIGIDPATQTLPEEAQLCYDPPEGLRTGVIDASVVVQEPNGISPITEIVEWRFRVAP